MYPNLRTMPRKVLLLLSLLTCFIFLCGLEHLTLYLHKGTSEFSRIVRNMMACVSVATVLYLVPMVPNLMSDLNGQMLELRKLNESLIYTKRQMLAISLFSAHEMRNPICAIKQTIRLNAAFYEEFESTFVDKVATLFFQLEPWMYLAESWVPRCHFTLYLVKKRRYFIFESVFGFLIKLCVDSYVYISHSDCIERNNRTGNYCC